MNRLLTCTALLVICASGVLPAQAARQSLGPAICQDTRRTEPVLQAARSGDIRTLRRLLAAHRVFIGPILEVHGCIGEMLTPLHAASEKGQLAAARFLASRGAKVSVRNTWGQTPLHEAATPEMASFLLSKGADIEARDRAGHTPLHVAAESGRRKVTAFLRSKGARVASIYDAVLVGDAALVRRMLERDPKLANASERDGTTPLCYAAATGQVGMVNLLLERGAEARSGKPESDPLAAAAGRNQVATARVLLDHGANPNAKQTMESLLSQAAWSNRIEMAKLLIEHGADVDAGTEAFDLPPLHTAVFYGNDKIAELLISHGADVDKKIDDGRAPLHFAASAPWGDGRCVSLLLDRGAEVNAEDNDGRTALAYSESRGVVRALLAHGATINCAIDAALAGDAGKLLELIRADPSALRETPAFGRRSLLHCAAIGGSSNVAEILIKRGVKASVPDINGETPLHFAAQNGNTEVARVLIAHGAEVNARAMERAGGRTPLEYALSAGHKETAALLRQHGGRR